MARVPAMRTLDRRPDLLAGARLDEEEQKLLEQLREERKHAERT